MKRKISLCLIVKNESQKIQRALDSIQQYVDEICITDTGSTDDTVSVLKALPYADKIKISYHTPETHPKTFFEDGAIRSFAWARNFNFSQATGDWILWMDADDIIRGGENINMLIELADQQHIVGFFLPYEYLLDKNGRALETHPKLQLSRNTRNLEWKGNVHEDLVSNIANTRFSKTEAVMRSHVMGNANDQEKSLRNLRIIMEDLKEQGDNPDPRTLFYGARAFLVMRDAEAAIPLLEKYITLSGWNEELYEGHYLLGQAYLDTHEYDLARDIAFRAMRIKPQFPDAQFLIAQTYMAEKNYEYAKSWIESGMKLGLPKGHITTFPHRYTVQPKSMLAVCKMMMNDLDGAAAEIAEVAQLAPDIPEVKNNINLIAMLKKKKDIALAYGKICHYLEEKGRTDSIKGLLDTAQEDMKTDPYINMYRIKFCPPTIWPKKSVVIAALGVVEAWSPRNEKDGGIGGSEEAVLNLSREFKELGYDVTVYTNTGPDDGDYDGVHWKMFTEMNWNDTFDTLVLWRNVDLLNHPWKANKFLFDMHDVAFKEQWTPERIDRVDNIMVKSEYHKSLLPEEAQKKAVVVGNGIKKSQFEGKDIERQKHRCIYPSTIDRGLDVLLGMWPSIRKEVPDAELHIYYGFVTYEALNRTNPERMRYLKFIKDSIKELEPQGVVYHGRVDHETLADEFRKCDVWLYPTQFPEIHCITALKAQKAGAVPVTTNYAALDETVKYGVKIDGDTYKDAVVQKRFVDEAIRVLKDDEYKESIRPDMAKWADENDWSNVAKRWDDIIKQ